MRQPEQVCGCLHDNAVSREDDPELRITCRTRTALPAVPDIIGGVLPLLVIDGQALEVNFLINPNPVRSSTPLPKGGDPAW